MRQDGVMKSSTRIRIFRLVQVAVAAGLLIGLWQFADGADALTLLAGAHLGWIIAATAVLSLQIVLSALRWQITARQLGITLSRALALREYYLSQIINQTLPGGVLGDAGRAVRSRSHAGMVASAQSVILERLAGQIGLILVFSGAFLVTLSFPAELEWPGGLASTLAVVVVFVFVAPFVFFGLARLLPPRSRDVLRELERSALDALAAPSVRWRQLGLSLATALTNISGFVFCAWALDIPLNFGVALAIVPLVLFTMLIPITVSGWGVREAAAAALFPLAGLSAAQGLATSVAFGIVLLVIALPGLWFLRAHQHQTIR
jgi:uncharacterized membrane protein YbhN (UPF0104 family)